ncbi:MAG: ParB-like nuclease domain-containing protein [Bacteroidetes bacterium]|nr:ParB-like nuclease domain-containing protein [Bacteroidota bacterium]
MNKEVDGLFLSEEVSSNQVDSFDYLFTNWVGKKDIEEKVVQKNFPQKMDARQLAKYWYETAYSDYGQKASEDDIEDYLNMVPYEKWDLKTLNVSDIKGHHSGHDASDEYIAGYKKWKDEGFDFPPILVEPDENRPGKYKTIDGQHRLFAAKQIGVKTIRAYVPSEGLIEGKISSGEKGDEEEKAGPRLIPLTLGPMVEGSAIKQADLDDAWEIVKFVHGMDDQGEFEPEDLSSLYQKWISSISKASLKKWKVKDAAKKFSVSDNHRRVSGRRLDNPIVVAKVKGSYFVIDGNHRLISKFEKGHEDIDVMLIPMDWADLHSFEAMENSFLSEAITEAKKVFTTKQVSNALKIAGRDFEDEDALNDEAKDLADFMNSFGSKIEVFRVVHAKSKDEVNLDRMGAHWTHSKAKALEFARHNLAKPWFLIAGDVSSKDVDWAQTLFQNAHHPYEEELHIPSFAKVKNVTVTPLKSLQEARGDWAKEPFKYFFGKEGYSKVQSSSLGSDPDNLKIGVHRSGHAYTFLPHRIKFYIERFGVPDFIHVVLSKSGPGLKAVYAEKGKDMIQLWSYVDTNGAWWGGAKFRKACVCCSGFPVSKSSDGRSAGGGGGKLEGV